MLPAELDVGIGGGVHADGQDTEFHAPFTYASKQLVEVLNMKSPTAGEDMPLRSVVVKRGINMPCEFDLTSKMALLFGVEPSLLMPTLWAKTEKHPVNKIVTRKRRVIFFIFVPIKNG